MKQTMKLTKRALIALTCLAAATNAAQPQSPYIDRVYDYRPAPGQFVNELPEYSPGDTQDDMNRKVEAYIAGSNHNNGMISLGGYGGYLVFGFDHLVENRTGYYDFRILANAFYANSNPNGGASNEGGSCEPGIVMVAYDANGNGQPDDPWYELAGSEYRKSATIHNYQITYHRPDESKPRTPHPSDPSLNDITYIRWTTNGHGDGYIYRNTFHSQSYYPQWIASETLSFEGTKLPDNYIDESGQGSYYVLYSYPWGYADNHPNSDPRSGFNIDWAVDASGNSVSLPGIHFVKVYTAVNQYCGWLGETSTEITGAVDLHLAGGSSPAPSSPGEQPDEPDAPGEQPEQPDAPGSVRVGGVTLSHDVIKMQPGDMIPLIAIIQPANATDQTVSWHSTNTAVADVTVNGMVFALAKGTATIVVTTTDGRHTAACGVSVSAPVPALSVATPSPQAAYSAGLLRLAALEGYDCTLLTPYGHVIDRFTPTSPDYVRTLDLPAGVYIITARNNARRITLKLVSKR